jgi:aryl-alcohol dehydrogenase-like predicted oxidoreductase
LSRKERPLIARRSKPERARTARQKSDPSDAAEVYYEGRNERFVGEVLHEVGEDLIVSTKLAPRPDGRGFERRELRAACRQSLSRLGRERIDVCFLHYPDESGVPLEETWSALGELADEGTVRAIGLSNYGIDDVERCHAIRAVDVIQDGLSLVDHLENRAMFERCRDLGIAVVVYEPLGSGTLSGRPIDRVREDWAEWSHFPFYERLLAGRNGEKSAALVAALRPIADRLGTTIPQLAIAWVLAQPGVTSAIAGSRNPEHVRHNAKAAGLQLAPDALAELEKAISHGPTVAV